MLAERGRGRDEGGGEERGEREREREGEGRVGGWEWRKVAGRKEKIEKEMNKGWITGETERRGRIQLHKHEPKTSYRRLL